MPAGCTLNADGSVTFIAPAAAESNSQPHNHQREFAVAGSRLCGRLTPSVSPATLSSVTTTTSYTRIDPRQVQSYKMQANYKPRPWAIIDGAVEIHENRDNVYDGEQSGARPLVQLCHDPDGQSAPHPLISGTTTGTSTRNRWCVLLTPRPPRTPRPRPLRSPCPRSLRVSDASDGAGMPDCRRVVPPGSAIDIWQHGSLRPCRRHVETHEARDRDVGLWRQLRPRQHDFPESAYAVRHARFRLSKPYASIAIDVYKNVTYKMSWNYYGFNETGTTNPFGLAAIRLQDFNGSNATFSFRYAF